MDIKVQILEVGKPTWVTKGKNKYQELTLKFKGDKGEQTRKFVSFQPHTEIFNQVKDLKEGTEYDVTIAKEGDFWNWKSVRESESGSAGSGSVSGRGGNRAAADWDARLAFDREKQPLIVRQSCIGYAIAFLGDHAAHGPVSDVDVMELAARFEHFVNTGEVPPEIVYLRELDADGNQMTAEVEKPKRRRVAEAVE